MWLILPMVSLLIRVIFGNGEINHASLFDVIGLRDENNDTIIDNRSGKLSRDTWKMWKGGMFKEEEGIPRKEIHPNIAVTGLQENRMVKTILKRKDKIGSWVDVRTKYKEFLKDAQEKGEAWSYWLEERLSIYGPNISCICKEKRGPFDGWGGKRSKLEQQAKHTKLAYNRYDRDPPFDGFNGVKRVAEMGKVGWKTPFNSWGGKRAEKSNDEQQFLLVSKIPTRQHLFDVIKDELAAGRNTGKETNNRMPNVYDEDFSSYPIPLLVFNGTNVPQQRISYISGTSDINRWLTSMPEKKIEQHGQYKKTKFNPWGGKRSFGTRTYHRYGGEQFPASVAAYTVNGNKEFFPIGNHN